MELNGYTGLYGVVAHPIKHSLSPIMHNTAFKALNINDVYLAFDVLEEDFKGFIGGIKPLNIKGFNVSMPYKKRIIESLDELTLKAQLCQAVNTVKNDHGHLIGHITDGEGFVLACRNKGWQLENQKIVILGAGGAACAIIVELALLGVKEIIVYNRSEQDFIRRLNEQLAVPIILKELSHKESLRKDLSDAYLLIQATSVGMNSNDCLIDESYLMPPLKVADIIYNPLETKLLEYARLKGLDYMNGIGMILYQGACAFKYWTNQDMPIEQVKNKLGWEKE